jgi:uncharacterized repeat protein (TIGR03803 family)
MHTFQGGSDGAESWAAPIMDAAGNFYGTTAFGGNGAGCPVASHGGCGTVYKIASDGTESVLHAFRGNDDGRYPVGGLTLDEDGNLYGTTQLGGSSDCQLMGCGTVFKIAPNGDETILHAFRDDDVDAAGPVTGLVRDSSGNLYGAGLGGGPAHAGAIFKIATDNTYSIVHTFTGTAKQQGNPNSLMIDRFDNIYGTSGYRAEYEYCVHCGTIFKLSRTGVFSTVHVFPKDTPMPDGALVKDSAGNLYGTTYAGGPTVCGCGTIFKLANDGSLTTLYSFQGGTDGRWPLGGMAMDRSGNLYGATAAGGTACGSGCGTLFKLDAGGTESVVYRMFRKKGASLVSGIMRGPGGVLYGTARIYGGGEGTFFKIKP